MNKYARTDNIEDTINKVNGIIDGSFIEEGSFIHAICTSKYDVYLDAGYFDGYYQLYPQHDALIFKNNEGETVAICKMINTDTPNPKFVY